MQVEIIELAPEASARWIAARATAPAVRFGSRIALLGSTTPPADASMHEGLLRRRVENLDPDEELHLIIQKGRLFQREHPDIPVLIDAGRYLLVRIAKPRADRIQAGSTPCFSIEPVREGRTVFEERARRAQPQRNAVAAAVAGAVSQTEIMAHVAALVGMGTRFSTGEGFRAALAYCSTALVGHGLDTRLHAITVPHHGMSANLIARRRGVTTPPRLIVTAHLDSVNHAGGATSPAPGADDNATGSAGVLELARVLSAAGRADDVMFVLFGGEEQGLHGSKQLVAAREGFDPAGLHGVVNMDMIGSDNAASRPGQPPLSVLLEGGEVSQGAIEHLADAAAAHTGLAVATSLAPHDSDHVPFIHAGLPAVLTIEGWDGSNTTAHTAADTIDRLKPELATEIVRMNAAALADWPHPARSARIISPQQKDKPMANNHRQCAAVPVYFMNLEQVPGLRSRQNVSRSRMRTASGNVVPRPRTIGVVVHVLYKEDIDNISDAQVRSQIDVLNRDFNMQNTDLARVPDAFRPFIGNPQISFRLAQTDNAGAPTTGITRKRVTTAAFAANDAMKSAATGGVDPWDPARFLNIWVCRLQGNLLGYAQFPDGGAQETDGVVITTTAFGVGGTAIDPFHLGRTATHEVGHYLGLFHIWGNDPFENCNDSDEVDDTPNQKGPNFEKPTFPTFSCPNQPNGDMFMNYMDYVHDEAMMMFSKGQVSRMHAALQNSRPLLGVEVA